MTMSSMHQNGSCVDIETAGTSVDQQHPYTHVTYVGAVNAATHSDNAVTACRINMIQEELWLMLCKKFKKVRVLREELGRRSR